MSNNQKTVSVKITRGELIDLMRASTHFEFTHKQWPNKWTALHKKLDDQLKVYDSKHKEVD